MRLLDLIKVITFCYTTRVRAISVVTKPRHRVVITRHIPHILSRYPHRHGGTGQPPDNLMKSIWHRDMNQSEPGLAKNTSSVCQYHSPSTLVGTSELRYVTTVCLSEWKTTKLLLRWWVSDFATNLWQSEQWPCHGWGVTFRDRGQSKTQSNSPLRHHLRRWQFKIPSLSESCLGGRSSFCYV